MFLPDVAVTVELDAEAFAAISLLATPHRARDLRLALIAEFNRNFTLAETEVLLHELAERAAVITRTSAALPTPARQSPSHAPESVHLQLNNICNLRCPSCYVTLDKEDAGSLPLDRIVALIKEWAEMGVFQLALGGGEALMSAKFVPVVHAARQCGIVPNVTTNGWLITELLLDQVQGSLGELRMSLNDFVTVNVPVLEAKASLMRARGMRFGFNLIATRCNLNRLNGLVTWACAQGAATINLIRPKPAPGNERWYEENVLRGVDASHLASILNRLEPLFGPTALTVDCGFSFLFEGQAGNELKARGVAGCAMGERLATVKWNGDVYPCSHLRGEQFKAGSVMTESFAAIWERSGVFKKVRRDLAKVTGSCAGCGHNSFCKGCRAVMWQQTSDWLAADTDCGLS